VPEPRQLGRDLPERAGQLSTNEEREALRRERLAAFRPSLLADIEKPDRGGSRRAEPSRPIRRQAASVPSRPAATIETGRAGDRDTPATRQPYPPGQTGDGPRG
jgi:hypothetical protein